MKSRQQGFTLIEVAVTVMITGVIMLVSYNWLSIGLKAWEQGNRQLELHQDLRTGMDKMVWEIRQGRNHVIYRGGDGNHYKIVFDLNGNQIEYYLAASEIRRKINGTGDNPITKNIKSLVLEWGEQRRSVIIHMAGSNGADTASLQTEVALPAAF